MLSRLIKLICVCIYWASATSGMPTGCNWCSSKRGCREGCPSRSRHIRDPDSVARSERGPHSQYSGCQDRWVTLEVTAPHYWCAYLMDQSFAHDRTCDDMLSPTSLVLGCFSTFSFEFLGHMTDFVLTTKRFVKTINSYIFFIFGVWFWLSYEILMQMLM